MRFAATFKGEKPDVPPIWLMRQAGRYLPEYRAVRERAGSFWTMCMTPDLAVEVTLQPIRRFDFDAAILFSDILVVPHALGQKVGFEDGSGPKLGKMPEFPALTRDEKIWGTRLQPVYDAMAKTRGELGSSKALIGFAGAPWTIAAYMIEGHGTPDQKQARLFAYQKPAEFSALLELLSDIIAWHLLKQLENGADTIQIFDSWAGGLPLAQFAEWVVKPTRRIVEKVRAGNPQARIIGFPRATTHAGYEAYLEAATDAVSIDTATSMGWAAKTLGRHVVLQGNLDPLALVAGGDALDRAIDLILTETAGARFVFNLGHGILPETPVAHVERLVSRVRGAPQ